jgi:putative ATP-binding cassette transporter
MEIVIGLLPAPSPADIAMCKVETLGLSLTSHTVDSDLPAQPDAELSWERLKLTGVAYTYYREGEETDFVLGPIDLTFHPVYLA